MAAKIAEGANTRTYLDAKIKGNTVLYVYSDNTRCNIMHGKFEPSQHVEIDVFIKGTAFKATKAVKNKLIGNRSRCMVLFGLNWQRCAV